MNDDPMISHQSNLVGNLSDLPVRKRGIHILTDRFKEPTQDPEQQPPTEAISNVEKVALTSKAPPNQIHHRHIYTNSL